MCGIDNSIAGGSSIHSAIHIRQINRKSTKKKERRGNDLPFSNQVSSPVNRFTIDHYYIETITFDDISLQLTVFSVAKTAVFLI